MIGKLQQLFSVDLRSLALFRVLLALSILLNLAILLPDAHAFLSDSGIYPRRSAMGSSLNWSLYFISGSLWFSLMLMLLNALAALALLVGYRTRLVTILCWVLAVSLDSRIFNLTSGADVYLRLLLFWGMFLPLGARCSVDEAMNRAPSPSETYSSWAVVAIFVQVVCLYLFSALLKTGVNWRETYDAVHYVLNSPEITTPLAAYFAAHTEMLRSLTFYVYHLELVAAIFLFAPVMTQQARLLMVLLLALMHVGFALLLSIGFFPLVCIAGLTVFLPPLFWEKMLPERRASIRIYYDEDCGFCRKTCLIFRALGMPRATEVLPAQQTPEIGEILKRENSWVVEDAKGVRRLRWQAVSWCWRRSPILWPLGVFFALPPFHLLGERFYRLIANHRADFGRLSAICLPETERDLAPPLPLATGYILAALAMITIAWNIATLQGKPQQILPTFIADSYQLLGLRQKMGFFAPQPISRSRWVVVEGELADGRSIDLLFEKDRAPSHELAAHGFDMNPGYRWRKFFSSMNIERSRSQMGRYFCRRYDTWKTSGMASLKIVNLIVYRQKTPPPGEAAEPAKKLLHVRHDCDTRRSQVVHKLKREKNLPDGAAPQSQAADLDQYLENILREPGADQ